LRIAQVSPLYESVPPTQYGGTERVVSYLTEELVRRGHDVTLFASGDSQTSARLVTVCERALRTDECCVDQVAHHILLVERVVQEARRFDIIHSHLDYYPYSLFRRQRTPHVTTLHGRLDLPDLAPLYREFADVPLISISDAQRKPLAWVNWQGTVHHGLPRGLYRPFETHGKYLAFLGRISPEKGLEDAIEVAARAGMELKIAAKVDKVDREYFAEKIRPLLHSHGNVEFVGEIGGKEKNDFLGNAYALLFLIDWPEPFGLVMIEAMACGTPVIARCRGSVAEVMQDGVTGFIVESVNEAVAAVRRIEGLSRARCRQAFETRFTAERMAGDYLVHYERLSRGRTMSAG
jgi:glycosyltransferase involved in cell wall biosynthesis